MGTMVVSIKFWCYVPVKIWTERIKENFSSQILTNVEYINQNKMIQNLNVTRKVKRGKNWAFNIMK